MPKVVWKKFLKGKHSPKNPRELLRAVRARARENMKNLIFIVQNMDRVAPAPKYEEAPNPKQRQKFADRQFAQIFADDLTVLTVRALQKAHKAGLLSEHSLTKEENVTDLMVALSSAGIEHDYRRLIEDWHYRSRMAKKLRKKEEETGVTYFVGPYTRPGYQVRLELGGILSPRDIKIMKRALKREGEWPDKKLEELVEYLSHIQDQDTREQILIRQAVLHDIDKRRGSATRSEWIEKTLRKALNLRAPRHRFQGCS